MNEYSMILNNIKRFIANNNLTLDSGIKFVQEYRKKDSFHVVLKEKQFSSEMKKSISNFKNYILNFYNTKIFFE